LSLADLIVHLCFPFEKIIIFYQRQSKGGIAFRAHKEIFPDLFETFFIFEKTRNMIVDFLGIVSILVA
jgi:hypothetical protein